jgi:hypothetical protein
MAKLPKDVDAKNVTLEKHNLVAAQIKTLNVNGNGLDHQNSKQFIDALNSSVYDKRIEVFPTGDFFISKIDTLGYSLDSINGDDLLDDARFQIEVEFQYAPPGEDRTKSSHVFE